MFLQIIATVSVQENITAQKKKRAIEFRNGRDAGVMMRGKNIHYKKKHKSNTKKKKGQIE